MDRLWNALNVWNASHPLGVLRASELAEWIDRGLADEIVRADPRSLAIMGQQASVEPNRFWLLSSAAERLEKWACEQFQLPPSIAGPDVRRLVFGSEAPRWLSTLLQADMHIDASRSSRVSYVLELIYRDGAEVRKLVIPVANDRNWDEMPADIRQQWIRHGDRDLTLPLYRLSRTRSTV